MRSKKKKTSDPGPVEWGQGQKNNLKQDRLRSEEEKVSQSI